MQISAPPHRSRPFPITAALACVALQAACDSSSPVTGDGGAPGTDGRGASTQVVCGTAAAETVATDQPGASAVVASETHVYWIRTGDRQLVRAAVGGGAVEVVAEKVAGYDLAVDSDRHRVYAAVGGKLTAISLADLSREPIGEAAGTRGIAVLGETVLWEGNSRLYAKSGGGEVQTIRDRSAISEGFRNVAIDEDYYYDGTARLAAIPRADAPEWDLPSELLGSLSLRVDDQFVYVASMTRLEIVAKTPQAQPVTAQEERVAGKPFALMPLDLAVDGDAVYVLTQTGVLRAAKGETVFRRLLSDARLSGHQQGSKTNSAITVNASHVFWTGFTLDAAMQPIGEVYRVAKCPPADSR